LPALLLLEAPLVGVGALAMMSLLMVGIVGLIDDFVDLPAAARLFGQLLAAAPLVFLAAMSSGLAAQWVVAVVVLLFALTSINFHNFMDGSNGHLACQALFVSLAIAWLGWDSAVAPWALVGAAAVVGFLPWNFPRARIFLGDVGSTTLGLWIAWLSVLAVVFGDVQVASVLIVISVFFADAGLTLLRRLLTTKRFLHAHRAHLYQWWRRRQLPHQAVVLRYQAWNMLLVLPLAGWTNQLSQSAGLLVFAALAAVTTVVWLLTKRQLLKARRGERVLARNKRMPVHA
jgi:UDP-N-acetylmuramyl pentapeptide phosphotransferase/UDP-N-acetylglucosamine-1-phosphate transferase